MRVRSGLCCVLLAVAACAPADEGDAADGADALTIPAPGCAAAAANNPHFEFQDDVCRKKVWPSDADRAWACPNRSTTISDAYAPAGPLSAVTFDTTTFADIPPELDLTIIAVRRDASGAPRYRYFSNGTHDRAFQPLSSTKFMAVANGASTLRARSAGAVGLPASVDGIPLGDLVTIIHNYNEQHYESNSLARYFENVGGRAKAGDLVHGWLGRPAEETFGGNYGAPTPQLSYAFRMPTGETTEIEPDDPATAPANHLSTLTMAEFLKRLVMHREDASTRLPGMQWADLEVLFYGSAHARWSLPSESGVVPKDGWGGMSADAAIYLQSAVNMRDVEARAQGKWRIFSKLGYGTSGFVANGYACFPELDADGNAVDGRGLELFVSTHFAQDSASSPAPRRTDAKIAAYYRLIVARLSGGAS